ncbi:DUF4192 family protein [Gulosibacter molinativorax]|uniref:DUF4192 domain-containing protein n=1 Tax=Gulosibacter molinativorax TaxID=256821 RepID=A0ABT7C3P0_9MICO|nr:DUF4192 family protein [Gulosibacter molinativorax]MDJ1369866.1 DUF4192 domain-containing protein [Gulosibacter molinativorax]QUY61831.1 Hypotetical protein [Gulosibacter molinativorax]
MSQTKRLRTAIDILNTVPEMVGYLPQNSLVLLPFTHGHGRACIRIDLPGPENAASPEEYALFVLHQLAQLPDANEVLFVVFTERPIVAGRVPFDAYQRAIGDALLFCGVRRRGAITVAANGWSSLDGSETGPLEELNYGAEALRFPGFDEFVAITRGTRNTRRSLLRAIEVIGTMGRELELSGVLLAWEDLLHDVRARREGGEAHAALSVASKTAAQAIVTVGFRDLLTTECILASAVYGRQIAEDLELVWMALNIDEDQIIDSLITDRLEIEPIQLPRAAEGVALLRELLAVVPERDAAAGYAALGWLEWARGSSSLSNHYSREALRRDPSHPIARLVEMASGSGVTPGWIREVGVTGGFTEGDFDELLGVTE